MRLSRFFGRTAGPFRTTNVPWPSPMRTKLREGRGSRSGASRRRRVPFILSDAAARLVGGKPVGAVNMLVDITERKRAEERQALLVRELHHRVKNMLATVQAIMGSTARTCATDVEEFQQSFTGRIVALARRIRVWRRPGGRRFRSAISGRRARAL